MRYKKDLDPDISAGVAAELAECAILSNMLDQKMQNVRTVIEKQND